MYSLYGVGGVRGPHGNVLGLVVQLEVLAEMMLRNSLSQLVLDMAYRCADYHIEMLNKYVK